MHGNLRHTVRVIGWIGAGFGMLRWFASGFIFQEVPRGAMLYYLLALVSASLASGASPKASSTNMKVSCGLAAILCMVNIVILVMGYNFGWPSDTDMLFWLGGEWRTGPAAKSLLLIETFMFNMVVAIMGLVGLISAWRVSREESSE